MSKAGALDVCRQWVTQALPTLNNVVYAQQFEADAARPSLPYATLDWVSDQRISATPYRSVPETETHPGDPNGRTHDLHVQERRRGVLRVAIYGTNAFDLAISLGQSVHRETESAILRQGGVTVAQISDILDTDELRDTIWEPSVSVDFAAIYAAEDLSPIGIIETVSTPLTMEDPA